MEFVADLIAGCNPGQEDCAVGTVPPGIDTWFIVLVLLLVLAIVTGAALLLRRWFSRRAEGTSIASDRVASAQHL